MSLTLEQLTNSHTQTQRRLIKCESDLDIADENYKSLNTKVNGFEDRIKYNHNDILDLMEAVQELEKDVDMLKNKKLVDKKSLLNRIFNI